MAGVRITVHTQAVLGALLEQGPDDELYGLEIVKTTELAPGTIYPILLRLRTAGWIQDRWESNESAQKNRRPARHYYKLTTAGRAKATHALQSMSKERKALSRLLGQDLPSQVADIRRRSAHDSI